MKTDSQKNVSSLDYTIEHLSILRITAIWAFSESAFGGILHALSIPLRGIFESTLTSRCLFCRITSRNVRIFIILIEKNF
ncbi:MAG: hypothetical protein P8X47_10770 [Ignavibacteriaceae bacterium]